MRTSIRFPQTICAVAVIALACSCGGGGGSSSGSSSSTGTGGTGGTGGTTNNVAQLIVDAGPGGIGENDLAYTTIQICVPGTTTCQTIDHVQVDTGSEGLRILSSVLTVSLPQQSSGSTLECTQFADLTFLWGPIATADIQIAGESAKSVPVQVANGSGGSPAVPASCSQDQNGNQLTQIVDVPGLGANAILGVGAFRQDCGPACAVSSPPLVGTYYACTSGGCNATDQSLTMQVQNPVWMFASDNNGVLLQLPSIPDSGQVSASGSLIFGIGTQSNNALGSASVLQIDPNSGNFTVKLQTAASSSTFVDNNFIDSGSNGFFFLDSATLINQFNISMPDCPSSSFAQGFYCPGSETAITASMIGNTANGTPIGAARSITFNVGNGVTLIGSPNTAFNDLGGDSSGNFDFGLPFFFGRSVYSAIEGQNTPAGTGPYVAF